MATSQPLLHVDSMSVIEAGTTSGSSDSSSDSSERPTKRRKQTEVDFDLTGRSADKFVRKVELFSGPQVIVHVGGKDFKLPKGLLCFYSPYFKATFNRSFKEAIGQRVEIPDFGQAAFEMVIQWMFQEEIVLPSFVDGIHKMSAGKHKLTQYLNFLQFADYLSLLGDFRNIHTEVCKLFSQENYPNLQSSHIRIIMELPADHTIQVSMIKLVAWEYISALLSKGSFLFQKELNDLDDFAAQLMREVTRQFKSSMTSTINDEETSIDMFAPEDSFDSDHYFYIKVTHGYD